MAWEIVRSSFGIINAIYLLKLNDMLLISGFVDGSRQKKWTIDSLLSCLHDSETGDPHLQVIAFAMSSRFIEWGVSKLFEKETTFNSLETK